jgi:hypothetical protein
MPGDSIAVIALLPGDLSLQKKTFGPAGLHLRAPAKSCCGRVCGVTRG